LTIFSLIKRLKTHYITLLIFSAVTNLLMLAPSWYMLQVYDRVLTSYDDNTLFGLSLIVVFLYLVYALLERCRGVILVGVSEELDQAIAPQLHRAILSPSLKERQKELNGLNDLNAVKQFLTGQPILSFLDTPWVLIYIGTIFLLHPSLGLLSIASAATLFVLAVINQRVTEGRLAEAQGANIAERKLVANVLGAADSIQTMGMRAALGNRLALVRSGYLESYLVASLRGVNLSSLSKGGTRIWRLLGHSS
jgi:ABC-type protease/lipase transport system fused ATPase/permease subunit